MKNTTIEIHGVQAFSEENKPNIILEFPGYPDELVTEISFSIEFGEPDFRKCRYFSIKIDYRILNKVFLEVSDTIILTSFIIDSFPKAEKFKFTKEHNVYKGKTVCEVSNIWSEKNRTMFLDYYPEYLLPKP